MGVGHACNMPSCGRGHSCLVSRAQAGLVCEHVASVFQKAWSCHQAPSTGARGPPMGCSPFLALEASGSAPWRLFLGPHGRGVPPPGAAFRGLRTGGSEACPELTHAGESLLQGCCLPWGVLSWGSCRELILSRGCALSMNAGVR